VYEVDDTVEEEEEEVVSVVVGEEDDEVCVAEVSEVVGVLLGVEGVVV
jgi:hypothetical protein